MKLLPISSEEINDYNARLLSGRGILRKLKGHVKKFGEKAIDFLKSKIAPHALDVFMKVANEYRKNIPGARPLERGELHPGGNNFLGPGTKYKKYKNVKPISPVDAVAKEHDAAYDAAASLPPEEEKKAIIEADRKMIADPRLGNTAEGRRARLIMLGKYTTEQLLSLMKGEPTTIYSGSSE